MTGQLFRLELAASALAATVLAVMLVVGIDALRFHGASPGAGGRGACC